MAKKTAKTGVSKADFVRGIPDKPARDAVAEGAEVGLHFKVEYVHVVRSADKMRKKAGKPKAAAKSKAPAKSTAPAKATAPAKGKSAAVAKAKPKKGVRSNGSSQQLGENWWSA